MCTPENIALRHCSSRAVRDGVDEQTAAFPGSPAGPAGSLPDRIPATSDKD